MDCMTGECTLYSSASGQNTGVYARDNFISGQTGEALSRVCQYGSFGVVLEDATRVVSCLAGGMLVEAQHDDKVD
jgi:hypothetical protein